MTDPNGKPARPVRARRGLTLVEMLVAMAITLLIMAAVVTVFANVSGSVTRRRATIEMASSLRQVRQQLARDLAGATCPAVPWQRPESNVGYLEIIEGPQNDYYPSPWLWDSADTGSLPDGIGNRPGIDLAISSLPGSNLGSTDPDVEGRGLAIGSNQPVDQGQPTDGRGLGDADDILMFTTRSEDEPFVGRIPDRVQLTGIPVINDPTSPANGGRVRFADWEHEEVESSVAEVVWFAVENPSPEVFALGEPGFRTIHRRALLVLPGLDYSFTYTEAGVVVRSKPGVVRVLAPTIDATQVDRALAALIAFQERFDLSVRVAWDPLFAPETSVPGRWVIRANSLSDLTKPENRFEHHGLVSIPQSIGLRMTGVNTPGRYFPFAVASGGIHGVGPKPVRYVYDVESDPLAPQSLVSPSTGSQAFVPVGTSFVASYEGPNGRYPARPLTYVEDSTDSPATVRAVLSEDREVVHLVRGIAPLGGDRRGDDIMITDALGFDIRVFDPAAPTYAYYPGGNRTRPADQLLSPGDPAWPIAYTDDWRDTVFGNGTPQFAFERQGAYVDLAYGRSFIDPADGPGVIEQRWNRTGLTSAWDRVVGVGGRASEFFADGVIRLSIGPGAAGLPPGRATALTQGFATYDTWSWHYETNGVNEDGDLPSGGIRTVAAETPAVDEGVDGLDAQAVYPNDSDRNGFFEPGTSLDNYALETRNGPDDYAERETRPPYDTALRGLQVALRVYERDSRQIREVKVRESFVPE